MIQRHGNFLQVVCDRIEFRLLILIKVSENASYINASIMSKIFCMMLVSSYASLNVK